MSLKKILIVRNDRLGDTLICVPTLQYVRRALRDYKIDFFCQREPGEFLLPWLTENQISWVSYYEGSARALKKVLQGQSYRAVLLLHSSRPFALASLMAGIPIRVGPLSKLSSLVLNHGIRQKRSLGLCPEAQYNLELAHRLVVALGGNTGMGDSLVHLDPTVESIDAARSLLRSLHLTEGSFAAIHPGMGGSGLNISAAQYFEIIQSLSVSSIPSLVTLGPTTADRAIVEELRERDSSLRILEGLSLDRLAAIFRLSRIVVAPSTGPLHLAHYVGARTFGLFSPVQSHRATRWAPWGGSGKSTVSFPELACPGIKDCVGKSCPHYLCMDKVPWGNKVAEALHIS